SVSKRWKSFIDSSDFIKGKSIGIVPYTYSQSQTYSADHLVFGFGVCPVTRDPTVVKIKPGNRKPWHVEVFTLSSGVWNVIPSSNLLRQLVGLTNSPLVVTDRFIYWAACGTTFVDRVPHLKYIVVSFDLITKEFKVVDLPDSLTNARTNELYPHVSPFICKLRESLVVYGNIEVEGIRSCGVYVMEHDSSFRKLFSIGVPVYKILGFSKSGEPVFESLTDRGRPNTLDIYDPCSQHIKNLGISEEHGSSFFMDSYKESLLLLAHSDLHIYYDRN
ncbi:hypothetical protein Tco_1362737, partial [Tanacetum coccineum]